VVAQATANTLATAAVGQVQQALATGTTQAGQAIATRDAVVLDLKSTRAREWAAVAQNQIPADPKLALLIALEAERLQHTQGSDDAIRRAFVAAFPSEGLIKVGAPVNDARFSPDGKLLVTASRDGRVILWDITSRQVLTTIRAHFGAVNAAVFSKDGARLVSAGADRTVRVWDATTGRSVIVLSGHTGAVNSVDFSPDGTLVISGAADKTTRIWNVAGGSLATAPIQFTGVISSVRFVDGSEVLVDGAIGASGHQHGNWQSGSFEDVKTSEPPIGTITGWDAASPDAPHATIYDLQNPVVLPGHSQPLTPAHTWLSPDKKIIVTTSADNTIRLHPVQLEVLVGRAKELLGRELSCDERVRYLSEKVDCAQAATPTPAPTK